MKLIMKILNLKMENMMRKNLEEALMINKRAEVILKHYEKYRSERALGFCTSRATCRIYG